MDGEFSPGAMSVVQFCRWAGIGKTRTYEEIAAGRLRAVKFGAKTLILRKDAEEWLEQLPQLTTAFTPAVA
jgi:excisionase family DNA binding protein